jgi:catalase
MSSHPERSDAAPLSRVAVLTRFATIGVIVGAVLAAFAWAAGWFTPARLTPAKLVDTFEQVNGAHPGFRRNHAKGVCIAGAFDSNGAGASVSKASVFGAGRVAVSGRFALAGGQPYAADAARSVRSMALRFRLADGEEWRTGMNDIPVFAVKTPQEFEQQLAASRPDPATGKPDPAMKSFLDAHPQSARAIATIKAHAVSSGFGDDTYNSLDAFRFVDAAGKTSAVRWAMVPLQTSVTETTEQAAQTDKNYLFDALIADVARKPLQWHLIVTLAQPGDATDDATVAWPADRTQIDVGTLTIDRVESEDSGACRDLNFDPLVLPAGIEASDDPLLGARSAVYAQSVRRRAGEKKDASAVTATASGSGSVR